MDELEGERQGGLPDFVRDPKGVIRRRWGWMLAALVVGLGATTAFVVTIPVRYVATSTILVSSQQISEDFVRSTVPDDPFQRINAMVGESLSRDRLLSLIRDHDLYPELEKSASAVELVTLMRQDITIADQGGIGPRARNDTSSIYAVSFRHADPQKAADIANELASFFTAASNRQRNQQARLTTDFLRSELERTEAELREQDKKIAGFKERYRGELPGELNANLAKLDRLNSQRQSLSMQIADAETRLAMLTTAGDPTSSTSPAGRLEALRAKLAEELSVSTPEHPNVISLKRQVEALEAEIKSGRAPAIGGDTTRPILIQSAQRTIGELKNLLAQVDADIISIEKSVDNTPQREQQISALEERATVLRENYVDFLRKVQAAELSESLESAQQGERVSVLDRALPPVAPEKTRIKYLMLGVLGSLGAAMALGGLLELLDPVMVSADQIEEAFDLPVLGSVPRIS